MLRWRWQNQATYLSTHIARLLPVPQAPKGNVWLKVDQNEQTNRLGIDFNAKENFKDEKLFIESIPYIKQQSSLKRKIRVP